MFLFLNVEMATNHLIVELNKDNKLNRKNYDLWNDQELLEHTEILRPPVMTEGVAEAQHHGALDGYASWHKKDSRARIILLSSMNDDLMVEYQQYQIAKEVWDQLIFAFGGTSTTRLRSLVLKFEVYRQDPKHTMTEHLRVMSGMIHQLNTVGHILMDGQQIQAVIRSLPESWTHMTQSLTHNVSIKMFADISHYVELEATRQAANRITTLMEKTSISDDHHKANGPKQKYNYRQAKKQKRDNKLAPKANKVKKR